MTSSQEYEQIYQQLLSSRGRAELGEDIQRQEKIAETIQKFLDTYPQTRESPNRPWIHLSLHEIFRRTLRTMIEIIQDVSNILSVREYIGNTTFRRRLFEAFTKEDRRIYVGIWLIFLSFVLYFIDSAA